MTPGVAEDEVAERVPMLVREDPVGPSVDPSEDPRPHMPPKLQLRTPLSRGGHTISPVRQTTCGTTTTKRGNTTWGNTTWDDNNKEGQ